MSGDDVPSAPFGKLLVKKLSDKGKLPTRGSALSAGYDLYSAEKKVVPAHGKALIDLQISVAVPVGTYGRVAPRSGLASKFMIDTGAGVVDSDYRGILFVLLYNYSDKDFQVEEGDRIAQLILERIYTPEVAEVEVRENGIILNSAETPFQNLDETARGTNGWGSTGGHQLLQNPNTA
ncbi:hypothetical protein M378DRAFT_176957 [Amanita muscaria Koide BX008]|uniref:Deoxyuridine 5'-triphosphate nucleotidohydrolase n=1 Tax=Amanita muscaria (strain Koide BX008) TaxID=946122 RepID=A0A0C2SXK8_AMAMK|nr:hypothetical protein M378DRAFT_176957 [Amanita muscaria Koide BX008]